MKKETTLKKKIETITGIILIGIIPSLIILLTLTTKL